MSSPSFLLHRSVSSILLTTTTISQSQTRAPFQLNPSPDRLDLPTLNASKHLIQGWHGTSPHRQRRPPTSNRHNPEQTSTLHTGPTDGYCASGISNIAPHARADINPLHPSIQNFPLPHPTTSRLSHPLVCCHRCRPIWSSLSASVAVRCFPRSAACLVDEAIAISHRGLTAPAPVSAEAADTAQNTLPRRRIAPLLFHRPPQTPPSSWQALDDWH